jgi:putative transposase
VSAEGFPILALPSDCIHVGLSGIILSMKLVVKVKLITDPATDALLRQTAEQYRRACNALSEIAFLTRVFLAFDLHTLAYDTLREQYKLPAQLAIRAIAEVASAYKSQLAQVKEHNRACRPGERRELTQVEFAPNAAIVYDQRGMSYGSDDCLSLRLLESRVSFRFQVGQKHRERLKLPRGQADLKRYGKHWFLLQTVEVEEPELQDAENCVGVDCGIATLASSHDGCQTERHPGERVRQTRKHYSQLRRSLQRHNTKSSRRRVRKLRNKEARIVRSANHLISRRIVEQAKRTNSSIVLEDLEGIREGLRVPQSQRYERFSWSYFQLQQMIVYKAMLEGIAVMFVPPQYTSQACSRCHYCSRSNRREQKWFQCQACGYFWLADDNAAVNIRFLGAESTRHKRTVSMEEYFHRDCRKLTASAVSC